uniref:Uncharacterized protein TCIL3000_10_5030 n=1 Tax=Trypanosoma congolense (strain IL3000) TaxID=1068625 RepID=G0UWH3_TRYCI|nr:unnamed protein product [Trypanosoma congolense IL3000]
MLEIEGNSLLNTRPLTRGRTVTPLNCSHFASVDDSRSCEAMMEVCNELQEEVRSLHQQYKETIERAAAEDVSPDIVTGTLSRITALMDRKSEQIRLIKEAQRDLKNAGAVVSDATRSGIADRRRRSTPVGADKSTKRNLIVNELRSLVQRR